MVKTVFTNGCFDIIHAGHVDLLERARALGDRLIVGINSDGSVSRIKGPSRPVNDQVARTRVLKALRCVDEVIVYDESTPERLVKELAPDILVKGGDWEVTQIVGAEDVLARGGQVLSLPLVEGFSTTAIIERILTEGAKEGVTEMESVKRHLDEHLEVVRLLAETCTDAIERSGTIIVESLRQGNKVMICGNGGSAADAQHIAAELVGRFERERRALAAIALTTDTSALTAIANDYSFESVYARQVEGLARPGDVLICISTSGNSPNIIAAAMAAREIGCRTVGLTGKGGKKLASVCDDAVLVPSARTARIQEAHITIGHIWCDMVDERINGNV